LAAKKETWMLCPSLMEEVAVVLFVRSAM